MDTIDSLLLVALTCCTPRLIRSGRVEKYIAKDIIDFTGSEVYKAKNLVSRLRIRTADDLLLSACTIGSLPLVRWLLHNTTATFAFAKSPVSAFHLLCYHGHHDILRFLIREHPGPAKLPIRTPLPNTNITPLLTILISINIPRDDRDPVDHIDKICQTINLLCTETDAWKDLAFGLIDRSFPDAIQRVLRDHIHRTDP